MSQNTPTDNTEWLDEQIGDVFARACKNNEYFGNDGWYELHTPTARQEIKALIDTVCREARIDELTKLTQKVECLRSDCTTDHSNLRRSYVQDRLTQLNPNKDTK